MTLTEFLLARIAEDERTLHCEWGCHERVYLECGAKRRIVERWGSAYAMLRHDGFDQWVYEAAQYTLCELAATYADHADYQPEWKP